MNGPNGPKTTSGFSFGNSNQQNQNQNQNQGGFGQVTTNKSLTTTTNTFTTKGIENNNQPPMMNALVSTQPDFDFQSCHGVKYTSEELEALLADENKKSEMKELIIGNNCCNDMKGDLVISGFKNLEKIVILKTSLQNLNSLKICDNEKLSEIATEGDDLFFDASMFNVKSLIIESTFII